MWASNVDFSVDLAGIERHGNGEGLERRTHLVDAGGQPVDAGRIERFARIVRVEIRLRNHRDNFAGTDIEHDTRRRDRAVLRARFDQFVAQRVLYAQIDGELHGRLQTVGRETRDVKRLKPLPVEPLLDAGDALVVDIDGAKQMRDFGAVRIVALVLIQEADAGQALTIDFRLLLRSDVALEPHEAPLRREPFTQFRCVEIGQIRGE